MKSKTKFILLFTITILVSSIANKAYSQESHTLEFRSKNNGDGGLSLGLRDFVGAASNADAPDALFHNDDARSLLLFDVRVGAVIQVDDSKNGDRSDDWCLITVKQSAWRYIVASFQNSYEDDYVKVEFHATDGKLDGKVSSVKIIN